MRLPPRIERLTWFVAIWAASVATLAIVAWLLRIWIAP